MARPRPALIGHPAGLTRSGSLLSGRGTGRNLQPRVAPLGFECRWHRAVENFPVFAVDFLLLNWIFLTQSLCRSYWTVQTEFRNGLRLFPTTLLSVMISCFRGAPLPRRSANLKKRWWEEKNEMNEEWNEEKKVIGSRKKLSGHPRSVKICPDLIGAEPYLWTCEG